MTDCITPPIHEVPQDWIDYSGHMNLSYYVMALDRDQDVFRDQEMGVGTSHVRPNKQGPFTLQNHMHYLEELLVGEQYSCHFMLLDGDAKRLHVAGTMIRERDRATVCVMEQILVNVDHVMRRSTHYSAQVQTRIAALPKAHRRIDRPPQVGRQIRMNHA